MRAREQPGWDQVWTLYVENADVFRGVFVSLARRGMRLPDDVHTDLVHHFLLERSRPALGRYDPRIGPIGPWLAVVFRRFVLEQLRAEERHRRLLERVAADGPRDRAPSEGAAAHARSVLQRLPPDHRNVLGVYLAEGRSIRRVAATMGISRYRARGLVTKAIEALTRTTGWADEL